MKARTQGRYLARLERGTRRPIVTPEGTALDFVVASGGDRLGAFLIDFVLQTLVIVVLVLLLPRRESPLRSLGCGCCRSSSSRSS